MVKRYIKLCSLYIMHEIFTFKTKEPSGFVLRETSHDDHESIEQSFSIQQQRGLPKERLRNQEEEVLSKGLVTWDVPGPEQANDCLLCVGKVDWIVILSLSYFLKLNNELGWS